MPRSRPSKSEARPQVLTPRLLRAWPLPQPARGGDKEERGRVLVIGGDAAMPGAVILAATAALRAGAGKVRIAVPEAIATAVGAAVPEAFVLPFAAKQSRNRSAKLDAIVETAGRSSAVLLGPGMLARPVLATLMRRILAPGQAGCFVLDALALELVPQLAPQLHRSRGRIILTPHAGEMAALCGRSKNDVAAQPLAIAQQVAARLQCVIAMKGRETFICAPHHRPCVNKAGNVGLATSGSGDTLGGVIAGLAARGADARQAAAWGVYLHAAAGDRLARKMGGLGYLARELLAEIPPLMHQLSFRP